VLIKHTSDFTGVMSSSNVRMKQPPEGALVRVPKLNEDLPVINQHFAGTNLLPQTSFFIT